MTIIDQQHSTRDVVEYNGQRYVREYDSITCLLGWFRIKETGRQELIRDTVTQRHLEALFLREEEKFQHVPQPESYRQLVVGIA